MSSAARISLALLVAVVLAAPARAATTTVVPAKVGPVLHVVSSTIDQVTRRTINQTASGQILASPTLTSMSVSIECGAVATPNPLGVGIAECYLLAPDGTHYNIPLHGALSGAADATVSAILNIPVATYRVCMRSDAFFQDNYYLGAPTVCSS
jgi:hypothetical protein